MKILHVAVFTPNSTNVWQSDGFESIGHQVIRYDYRTHIKGSRTNRDNEIIYLCQKEKPAFVLIAKGGGIPIRVIKGCKKSCKVVYWYPDKKCILNSESSQDLKESDYVFASCKSVVDFTKKYHPNAFRLQGGYNPKIHKPILVPKKRDVCFIGRLHTNRGQYQKAVKFPVIAGVYGLKLSQTISETKINLNFSVDGVSNRIYKILAAGGFLLTNPWDTMGEDFVVGKDFDVFSTPDELKSKIQYYLNHEKEREKIAMQGYQIVKKYNHINYARRILEKVAK